MCLPPAGAAGRGQHPDEPGGRGLHAVGGLPHGRLRAAPPEAPRPLRHAARARALRGGLPAPALGAHRSRA
eukprot:8577226-Pyramimonas_sp.AAC.1